MTDQKAAALERLFPESCAEIEAAYARLGHRLGWRFLTSPRSTLGSEIALITMNPGGSEEPPDHGRESSEAGSAYIVERWAGHDPGVSPLQRQVRGLFAMLAAAQGSRLSGDELLHRSLTAHFVPFRSPRFEALEQPEESLAFASQLWTKLLERLDPKLIIAIDRRTTRELSRILKKSSVGRPYPRSRSNLGGAPIPQICTYSNRSLGGRSSASPTSRDIEYSAGRSRGLTWSASWGPPAAPGMGCGPRDTEGSGVAVC